MDEIRGRRRFGALVLTFLAILFLLLAVYGMWLSYVGRVVLVANREHRKGLDFVSQNGVRHSLAINLGLVERPIEIKERLADGSERSYIVVTALKVLRIGLWPEELIVPIMVKLGEDRYLFVSNNLLNKIQVEDKKAGVEGYFGSFKQGVLFDVTYGDDAEELYKNLRQKRQVPVSTELDEEMIKLNRILGEETADGRNIITPFGLPTVFKEDIGLPLILRLWY